jgi:peptidyl-prolyl cis-trans isomerase B (cyclophilin B)
VPGKDRQRALARAKLERQMARRAAAARRRRQLQAGVGAAVAVVVVIAGVWFLTAQLRDDKPKSTTAAPAASASPAAAGACLYAKTPQPASRDVGVPSVTDVARAGTQVATVTTNQGEIQFEIPTAKAPCTAHSFTYLAGKKFYDNTSCHRLLSSGSFALQCGDPTGSGSGGPGYQFQSENLPTGTPAYPAGTVAMANSGSPDSNGSQFFFVYKETGFQPDYTVFGKVTKGLDVLTKIGAAGDDGAFASGAGGGHPKLPVKILKVTVTPAA